MANPIAELVFIPAPGLSHLMSTIELAKSLVTRDQRLTITFLLFNSPTSTNIDPLPNNLGNRISFIQLQSPPTPDSKPGTGSLTSLYQFIDSHCKHVRKIVSDMVTRPGSPRVAGFVIDMFCTSMIDVANEFNLPTYVFFTSNAAFLGFKLHIQTLSDDQSQDLVKLSQSDTDIPVPGFVKPVPTKVFPAVFRSEETLGFVLSAARRLREVKAIMVNSFLELETHAIESLCLDDTVPTVYPVGPILDLEGGIGPGKPSGDDVIRWLDDQPPCSVVFLCFGTMGSFDEVQVKEIARGLEQSGHRFLWSLRQPTSDQGTEVTRDNDLVLPEGFLERTAGIGKVIGWAPQVTMLAHRAVGGFVSHCGWNSLLESLWFGVPVATWPMYAEQQINAFEMVVELELAVEIKLDYKKDSFSPTVKTVMVTAEEIESGIRRLMKDDKVRTKVKRMSEKSRSVVENGGSSYITFGVLIEDFLRNIS